MWGTTRRWPGITECDYSGVALKALERTPPVKFIAPARVAALAVLGVLALAGCSFVNPIITQKPYAPADGLQAQIGEVHASNLIIVTTAEGDPGSLVGSLYNAGDTAADIVFSFDGSSFNSVTVPATSLVSLSIDGDATVVQPTPANPGRIANVTIQSDATGYMTTPVPVVDDSQAEFIPEFESLASVDTDS